MFAGLLFLAGRISATPSAPTPSRGGAEAGSAQGGIQGHPRVRDGDGLDFGDQRVRLFGVDAVELAQRCQDPAKGEFDCGRQAKQALYDLIGSQTVSCVERDRDQYGRSVAVCSAGGRDLNREMVSAGWAMAYRRFSNDYVDAENEARRHRRGIWVNAKPTPPWAYRSKMRR
jgi:endonuclease YncB( thermonuclease family)